MAALAAAIGGNAALASRSALPRHRLGRMGSFYHGPYGYGVVCDSVHRSHCNVERNGSRSIIMRLYRLFSRLGKGPSVSPNHSSGNIRSRTPAPGRFLVGVYGSRRIGYSFCDPAGNTQDCVLVGISAVATMEHCK